MSNLASTPEVLVEAICIKNDYEWKCNNNHRRCVKSNIFKHKCSKSLKNKLKKYKIRKNGEEDPDVLDVSKSLLSSLTIKSPTSQNISDYNAKENNIKPNNYLFKKMGKRHKCNILVESNREVAGDDNNLDNMPTLTQNVNGDTNANAFKLLMESRYKSIGTNSPGKERPQNDVVINDIIERREIKAKRKLTLQKLAEAKGSLKQQELEEQREIQIKKQMLKRAQRFKAMIVQDGQEVKNDFNKTSSAKKLPIPKESVSEVITTCKVDVKKTLQLCNIFESELDKVNKCTTIRKISDEDEEFLNKLSPSIRKKENMMSYFKKLPKGTDLDECDIEVSDDSCQSIIKVKFTPKRKKKAVKTINDGNMNEGRGVKISGKNISNACEAQTKESGNEKHTPEDVMEVEDTGGRRPKRIPKRPAKYIENAEIISSDEELHIFTPKKKKNSNLVNPIKIDKNESELKKLSHKDIRFQNGIESKNKKSSESKSKSVENVKKETNNLKNSMKSNNVLNTPVVPIKLAPIFMSKKPGNVDKSAKQKFLQSGILEKFKKDKHKHLDIVTHDTFQPVIHIQQIPQQYSDVKISLPISNDLDLDSDEINTVNIISGYQSFINMNVIEKVSVPLTKLNKEELLENIKKSYERFPVYRTYHLLKGKSKGEFRDFNYPDLDNSMEIMNFLANNESDLRENLCWVDKYRPNCTKQIIGNFSAIDELKRWLQTWTENLYKTTSQVASEGSDFSDFVDSDTDSKDSLKNSNNVLIISGDTGSGKTSCVYAVAAELAIKVIEVNASSKRTGKIMLQDLQEATRSHKVDRSKSNSDCTQNVQEVLKKKTHKSRGRPKKVKQVLTKSTKNASQKIEINDIAASQESVRTDMSLILIDDADIVFDQDDGFCSGISQLIHSSKRPVILVTSTLSCPHLQKFLQYGKIINMHRFLPRMLGVWLDIMCIADTGICYTGLGANLLDYFKGDIRKTINYLQFYMASNKYISNMDSSPTFEGASQDCKLDLDDECSSMSWMDRENVGGNNELCPVIDPQQNFIEKHMKVIHLNLPVDLLNVWWSLPKIIYCNIVTQEVEIKTKKSASKQLLAISNMLDVISVADLIESNLDGNENSMTSLWRTKENASVIETENLQNYNRSNEVKRDIASELAIRALNYTHESMNCRTNIDINVPGFTIQRERDKITSRHHTLTGYLNPGVVLDRKALALDYWSACRSICRLETSKSDINVKRNNRFCHYLKSLNVLCKNDYFDSLSKSLSTNDFGEM